LSSNDSPYVYTGARSILQQQKAALRQELRRRRAELTPLERAQKSSAICELLWGLPEIQSARTIHAYWPLIDRAEIDIRPLILRLVEHGKRIALPVLAPEDTLKPGEPRMHCRFFEGEAVLTKNRWGVSEPLQSECVPSEEIDAVVVPALGVSRNGYRIGYGKGHYDEWLNGLSVPTICPVYSDCLVDQVPVEPHDVPMTVILTENEIIRPSRT